MINVCVKKRLGVCCEKIPSVGQQPIHSPGVRSASLLNQSLEARNCHGRGSLCQLHSPNLHLGKVSVCLCTVGFPASTYYTHSSHWGPNLFRFAETFQPSPEILRSYHKQPSCTVILTLLYLSLEFLSFYIVAYDFLFYFIYWNNIKYAIIKVNKSKRYRSLSRLTLQPFSVPLSCHVCLRKTLL